MLVLNSEITIGSFRFSGVNEVRIRRSVHTYVETATITVPSAATVTTISKQEHSDYLNGASKPIGRDLKDVVTAKQFRDGDPVIIRLGYNGELREEFRGFIKRRNLNMPLEIECEGYSYQMRRNNVNKTWKRVKVSEVLAEAIRGTDVKLQVVHDSEIQNFACRNVTGADALDAVIKATGKALNAFFIKPDVLYVGLLYAPNGDGITGLDGAARVDYRLGWNVLKDNDLKERIPNNNVTIRGKIQKTKREKNQPAPVALQEAGQVRNLLLQHVTSEKALRDYLASLTRKENYAGYSGRITGFLTPYAEPGYKAFITDSRYKERDGVYFIESTDVTYGVRGARRVAEIGPKLHS